MLETLNEGRPFRAGNPVDYPLPPGVRARAQRRPALPGRQPHSSALLVKEMSKRSTKAGPSGPATPLDSLNANVKYDRSTKAGPSGPATPGERRCHRHGRVRGRSTKAGPSGPATRGVSVSHRSVSDALNEGRPFRAGNPCTELWEPHSWPRIAQRRPALPGRQPTLRISAAPTGPRPRSTKAGPSGPATLELPLRLGLLDGRRSTKAGPSGPATPSSGAWRKRRAGPLNEGRPFRAGNPP